MRKRIVVVAFVLAGASLALFFWLAPSRTAQAGPPILIDGGGGSKCSCTYHNSSGCGHKQDCRSGTAVCSCGSDGCSGHC